MNYIQGRSFDPSPIRIVFDSFDPVTGETGVTVAMYSQTYELITENFHIVLYEDDVTLPKHTHITRAIHNDTISLVGEGNTATFNADFDIDPTWDTTKLRAVAFVQLQDKEIIQVGASDPLPTNKVRAMVPFSRTKLGPSSGMYETGDVTVMNVGDTDTFEVSIVIDDAPAGWTVAYKDSVGTTHTDPLMFVLNSDESTTFKAVVMPTSPGFMRYRLVVDSPNLGGPLEIPFVYISNDVDVLLVDDDGGEDYENYFRAALDTAGKTYGVWDRTSDSLTTEVADTFDLLVWNVGFSFPTLDNDDKTFLAAYLDSGKGLFITGQDVGWDLNVGTPDPAWYQTYLHAIFVRDDTNIYYLDGVAGDPITDGLLLHIQGGDGANNQDYPDEITPADGDATEILNYQGDGCGAIRVEDSITGAKIVYLAFGFEAIDNPQDRHDTLIPAVRWIQGILFENGFESGTTDEWSDVAR